MLKKSSSQELPHQIGQYVEWSILRTRKFKFVQMKSLASQMATPYGDIIFIGFMI